MVDFDLDKMYGDKKGLRKYRTIVSVFSIASIFFMGITGYYIVNIAPRITELAEEASIKSALINSMNNTIKRQEDQIQKMNVLNNYTSTILTLTKNVTDIIANRNTQLQQQLADKEVQLQNIIEKLYSLQRGNGYILHDPTYAEMISFIANNTIDQHPYIAPTYVCYHFAIDLVNDAFQSGLRCGYVQVVYTNFSAHAVVAFQTSDRGLTYVEPQNDEVIMLSEGGTYWNNTIGEIKVVW